MAFPQQRLRRLRAKEPLRRMLRETRLSADDFIYPLFLKEGAGDKAEISSMPGVYHHSLDSLLKELEEVSALSIPAVLLFGLPGSKDETGSEAYSSRGIVQRGTIVGLHVEDRGDAERGLKIKWVVAGSPGAREGFRPGDRIQFPKLELTGALGTVSEIEGGVYTGRLAGAPLHGPAKAEAVRALLAFPEASSAPLVEAYQAAGSSRGLRRILLQVLGRSRDPAATRFLAGELAFADRQVLSDVLWALHLCGFRAAGADRSLVEKCFREEVRRGSFLVAARRDLGNGPGAELLVAALGQELGRTQKRIFLLLSFVLDPEALLGIWSNFSVSPALRDLSLELFEARVDRARARLALPVLAEVSREAPAPAAEQVRKILFGTRPRSGAWVRACAVDALRSGPGGLDDTERALLLDDGDELVRETARARWTGASGNGRRLPVVDRVRVLRGAGLFRAIDDELLAELAPRLEEVEVGEGEGVPEGGRGMYVVAEGSLRFEAPGEAPALLLAGQTFGELSALESEPSAERATALEPSRLLRLSDADLHDFMSMRIEVVRGIVDVLCQRARAAAPARAKPPEAKPQAPEPPAGAPARGGSGEVLSPLDRVLILKTAEIFSEVDDEVLSEVAARTREVRLRGNEVLFRKGDPGTTTFVVAAGRLRIHVADRLVAVVGERAVVGELAALSSEPRTASVTAEVDSLLLTLDQDSLFELMLDRQEIARGIIRVLVSRLRDVPSPGAP